MIGSTHANNRSARSPKPKPEGPARDNPIAGPRTGTTRSEPSALASAGASGRHKDPGSRRASTCPVQPPSKAGGNSPRGGGRHHRDGKADRSSESDRTGRGAAHQRGATRHAREANRQPKPRHEDRCQATTATGCREPGKRAQHATNRGTGEGAKDSRSPTPAHRTHGQWEAGPAARPEGREVVGGSVPVPGSPTPKQEAPPPRAPSRCPHIARSQHARARAVGLVTGPHARTPRTNSKWVVGSGRTPGRTRGRGWESTRHRTPHTQARGDPPGTHMPPPQCAKLARKSARCGVGDGSPRPHPPHPQPVGSGPRPHARKDEWSGVGERQTPDAPHPGRRRPPQAPSCRPHSVQSQLARARAAGLVTGPHARTSRTHSQWVVGPGRTPERISGRGWESARPRTPHTQARGAPPGHRPAAPIARKASLQERALSGW